MLEPFTIMMNRKCRQQLTSLTVSTIKIFSFSKRLKEVKYEMLEVIDWSKLFQTAGLSYLLKHIFWLHDYPQWVKNAP